jgi:hypothetical protein
MSNGSFYLCLHVSSSIVAASSTPTAVHQQQQLLVTVELLRSAHAAAFQYQHTLQELRLQHPFRQHRLQLSLLIIRSSSSTHHPRTSHGPRLASARHHPTMLDLQLLSSAQRHATGARVSTACQRATAASVRLQRCARSSSSSSKSISVPAEAATNHQLCAVFTCGATFQRQTTNPPFSSSNNICAAATFLPLQQHYLSLDG